MHVACVIEPDVFQLLGAYLQFLSLRSHPSPLAYHLLVVDRPGSDAPGIAGRAGDLGLECRLRPAESENPYFNRWLCLDTFPQLRDAPHVVVLDWDIIRTSDLGLPVPVAGKIGARPNPPLLYRRFTGALAGMLPASLVGPDGSLASSVNSGVIVADGASLARVAGVSAAWARRIRGRLPAGPGWEAEQFVTSLAVGEVGLAPLDPGWNVVPTSPVDDEATHLWHYNDGVDASFRLKRNLARPEVVAASCRVLAGRWPRSVARFEALYAEAAGSKSFRGLLEGPARRDPGEQP